jgi:exosortase B
MNIAKVIESSPVQKFGAWGAVLCGLLLLYVPVYLGLAKSYWQTDHGAHGPIILAVTLWLLSRVKDDLLQLRSDFSLSGFALLLFGLICYSIGRAQSFPQLEVGSQIPVLLGCVLLLAQRSTFTKTLFPVLFLLFLVPVPTTVLDSILVPLKGLVSWTVEEILFRCGYPIARSGVMLAIGPYQLLIADACSGLNSMVALSGIGLLYVYIAGHTSRWINIVLVLAVLPVAFLANILRVMMLVLTTYYFGSGAGQSFHDHAGYIEIVIAFGGFFLLDMLLVWLSTRISRNKVAKEVAL